MNVNWPDMDLPPINLLNAPRQPMLDQQQDSRLTLKDLRQMRFEDLPVESEKEGFGRNVGSKTREQTLHATNKKGVENECRVRITRHADPATVIHRQLKNAHIQLDEMALAETCPTRLKMQNKRVERLDEKYRELRRNKIKADPDKLAIKTFGRTSRQKLVDEEALVERNSQRDSSDFLRMMFDESGVTPNPTQFQMMADFLEGISNRAPFYFMSSTWILALERGGAVVHGKDGSPRGDGKAWRRAYHAFQPEA